MNRDFWFRFVSSKVNGGGVRYKRTDKGVIERFDRGRFSFCLRKEEIVSSESPSAEDKITVRGLKNTIRIGALKKTVPQVEAGWEQRSDDKTEAVRNKTHRRNLGCATQTRRYVLLNYRRIWKWRSPHPASDVEVGGGEKMRYLKFFCRITPVEESVHLWRNPRTFFSLKNRQRQLYSFASCFVYRIRLYHCTIIRRYRLTRSSPFFRKRLRKENKNFSSLTNYIDIYSLSRNFHSLFQRTPFSLRGSTK